MANANTYPNTEVEIGLPEAVTATGYFAEIVTQAAVEPPTYIPEYEQ